MKKRATQIVALVLCLALGLGFWAFPAKAEAGQASAVYQGTDYSPVYDFDFYVSYNQDLTPLFGQDPAGALNHFVNYGMAEGRRGNTSFDVFAYRDAYSDLPAAFGEDLKAYYLHYLNYGISEGRNGLGRNGQTSSPTPAPAPTPTPSTNPDPGKSSEDPKENSAGTKKLTVFEGIDYSPVYDFDYYIARNADVKTVFGMDQEAVLGHFVRYGMSEGRQGCPDFNVYVYRARYADVKAVFGDDLKAIYLHYLKYGISEGRYGSGPMPEIQAVTVKDGIDYSPVYDYKYYLAHNPDVAAVYGGDDEALLNHFVRWGMSEKRQAKDSFSVDSYRFRYQDLRLAYGTDWQYYYMHYLNYGQKERRVTSGVTELKNPVLTYKGTDFSKVYDYYYYAKKYPDIAKECYYDDSLLLKHFATIGINEGLIAKENYDKKVYDSLKGKYHPYDYPKAEAVLAQVGRDLKAAYDWSTRIDYYAEGLPSDGSPGTNYFAEYGFDHQYGNCYVYAATFTQMARLLGYEARQVNGGVLRYADNYAPHSWVEIDEGGTTYVYDPEYEWQYHNTGYHMVYGQSGRWFYKVYDYMTDEGTK